MKCKRVVGPHLRNAFQHLIALPVFEDAPPTAPALPHQLVTSTPVLVQELLGNLSQGEDQLENTLHCYYLLYVHSFYFKTKKTYVVL